MTETAWLIEQDSPARGSVWFSAVGPEWRFVNNANEALRFARKTDAETFIKWLGGNPLLSNPRATEHQWIDAARAEGRRSPGETRFEGLPDRLTDQCADAGPYPHSPLAEAKKQLFALCEDMGEEAFTNLGRVDLDEHQKGYYRGMKYAAKATARAMGEVFRDFLRQEDASPINEDKARDKLRYLIGQQSASEWARERGLIDEQVSAFLRGSRPLEPKLAAAMGLRRVHVYQHMEKADD